MVYMAMHDESQFGHERKRSSANGEILDSEHFCAASPMPHHAAFLYTHHTGIALLPLACGGGLRAWRVDSLLSFFCTPNARACVRRVFFGRKQKNRQQFLVKSITYINRRGIYLV